MSNYIMSAQKPTVVNGCVVGNFRTDDEIDLIIARINRIELLLVAEEGLKPYREIPIFGRIAVIQSFRPPGENKDLLLILTHKYQVAVLSFDVNGEVVTRVSGNVSDRVARPAETGIMLIAMRLYEGSLKIVNWTDSPNLSSFNIRLPDSQISDFCFLDKDGDNPYVSYIYQDLSGRHLKVFELRIKEKDICLDWEQENIESEASLLISVPNYGGVIVVGQESISYHKNAGEYTAVAPFLLHMAQICCYAPIDKSCERILLGDIYGRLFMLVLNSGLNDNGAFEIRDIKVQLLGEISIPECLVYLDNSVIFVGSRLGDSQLVRILSEPIESNPNSFVEIIDSYPNLGPVRDLIVMSNDGQDQVVTCSGGFKEGSLRIIRSGIGIEEQATVDLENIRNLFTLRLDSDLDNYLVVSFFEVTHLFKIVGEELEDTDVEGFDLNKTTLFAGTLYNGNALQVTNASVQLIAPSGKRVAQKELKDLVLCSVNPFTGQIVVGSGSHLMYLRASDHVKDIQTVDCERQVSCVDISPLEDGSESSLCAVGFWSENSVRLFSFVDDKLVPLRSCAMNADVLPRSVLLSRMEDQIYLMVALGDGTLFYYILNSETGEPSDPKKATLGTQPTKLKQFFARNTVNVFACSDRPAVIYSSNQKLVFSNVNLKSVTQMCLLSSEAYPNSLVLTDGERLFIGVIDDIQKLHIRSVPLGESVSRIAHQSESNSIAILTQRVERILPDGTRQWRHSASTMCTNKTLQPAMTGTATVRAAGPAIEQDTVELHSVCLLDVNTFEILHVVEMPSGEYALSVASVRLSAQPHPFYVIGTAIFVPEEAECKQGRILVYVVENQKLKLVTEKEVAGAIYSLAILDNKLICAVNSSVRLFDWTVDDELRLECSSFNFITALYLKTKGDLVLVGDIMRSMTLLAYKSMDSQFEEVARDYSTEWMTGCEIIDSDTMIGAENAYNLFTVHKDVQADNDEERVKLHQRGFWYLGENVNVFRHGALITSNVDPATPHSNPILFGTADGGLGVILQLKEDVFKFLLALQKTMANNINNCIRVPYDAYRNFNNEKKVEKHCGFVDGDLIESLADMGKDKVTKIVNEMNALLAEKTTVEYVMRLVEDVSRFV